MNEMRPAPEPAVESFAAEHGLNIVGKYVENESGAKPARPELFRLIADSRPDDVLLIEQVDRLSRLTAADWQKLRANLDAKQIRVVALDLPTSWMLAGPADDFMFRALNSMMLDMLAAVARKHYDDRRRRQAQGVAKAKAEGKYRGRPEDTGRNAGIASMLRDGSSWTAIQVAFGCSRATIAKVAKRAAPALHGALTNCSTLPSILRVSLFAQDRRRSEPVTCNDRRLM
jgi:DNA invertase Pin-like site-specific DNA recombinase